MSHIAARVFCVFGVFGISRRPAAFTQAEIARAIRAAKQAGASEVEIKRGVDSMIVRVNQSTSGEKTVDQPEEVVL